LRGLAETDGEQRRQLETCLRCCTRFPFAVLLSRLVALDSLCAVRGRKRWHRLEELLFLSEDEFWHEYCQDAEAPDRVVQVLNELEGTRGLSWRPEVACASGTLLSLSEGDQPG